MNCTSVAPPGYAKNNFKKLVEKEENVVMGEDASCVNRVCMSTTKNSVL